MEFILGFVLGVLITAYVNWAINVERDWQNFVNKGEFPPKYRRY